MNISLENVDKVSALLTLKLEKADYQEKVEKTLKAFRQKANIPGFRRGMVPMSLIKKQFGKSVLADEVDKLMQEKVNDYIRENKVKMLGMPLPSEKMAPIDFDAQEDFEFVFDIALQPEFKAEITSADTLDYYVVDVTDESIDQQVDLYARRSATYENVEQYAEGDMIKGLLTELDEAGQAKEGGISEEGAVMMPSYMPNDEQKALFSQVKVGDVVTFCPATAYDDRAVEIASLLHISKEEAEEVKSNFSYQVEEITRSVPAPVDQKLFDTVFGEGNVKSVEEFRAKIKEGLEQQTKPESQYKFLLDVRALLTEKVGKLDFPDALLKRIMLANNPDKDEAFVEENYEKSVEELSWQLIRDQLMAANAIRVEAADVQEQAKEATRAQFAQYGMMFIPDQLLENYSSEMLKKKETVEQLANLAAEAKLAAALKEKATVNVKTVSHDEFLELLK